MLWFGSECIWWRDCEKDGGVWRNILVGIRESFCLCIFSSKMFFCCCERWRDVVVGGDGLCWLGFFFGLLCFSVFSYCVGVIFVKLFVWLEWLISVKDYLMVLKVFWILFLLGYDLYDCDFFFFWLFFSFWYLWKEFL